MQGKNGEWASFRRWKVLTNTEKNSDVNSTPVVAEGLVIVATNANMAAGYDITSGKRVWVRRLNGPSSFGPLLFRQQLAAITDSVYLLNAGTAKSSASSLGKTMQPAGRIALNETWFVSSEEIGLQMERPS